MSTPHLPASVVAITGAAGALGSEVARRLADEGYRLALFDTPRSSDRLKTLAGELGDACVIEADLNDPKMWDGALAKIELAFGTRPTHGVLIAGGWKGGAPLHEADESVWTAMMSSNAETAYRSLRALLPSMVAKKNGSIVVVGSRVVERPWTSANAAAYAASKAAVVAMAQAVAAEVLKSGVRVNAILPSTLDTPANRASMPKADPTKWVTTTSAASVIAFLLSDASKDVSGAALPVYGQS